MDFRFTDDQRLVRETRARARAVLDDGQVPPASREMVLDHVAEHVLGLPRSY